MVRKCLAVFIVLTVLLLSACAADPGVGTDLLVSDSGSLGASAMGSPVTDIDSDSESVTDSFTDSLTDSALDSGSSDSSESEDVSETDALDSGEVLNTSDVPYIEITDSDPQNSAARPSVNSDPVSSSQNSQNSPLSSVSTAGTGSISSSRSTASSVSTAGPSGGTVDTDTPADVPAKTVSDLVIACDQTVGRVVVYNLENYNGYDLESCAVWSYTPPIKSGSSVHRSQLMSGVKYRTGTVFGDVILMCSSGRYAEIVTYPGKTVIWRDEWTVNQANNGTGVSNPHSIEILPGGNVVVAGSSGNVVQLFYTSARLGNPLASVTSVRYELEDAHGVLWDPRYQILWALGKSELVAYTLSGSGTSQKLVQCNSYTLPTRYGHDLSADFSSADGLWVTTNSGVYYFDKTAGKFLTNYANSSLLNRSAVKGFGNNRNESYFYCFPNNGADRVWASENYAAWCTDTIQYGYYNFAGKFTVVQCRSSTSAFYKVYSFQGQYQ